MVRNRAFSVLFLLLGGLLLPQTLHAQLPRRVGGFLGQASSRHIGGGGLNSDWEKGLTAGAYLDTATPLPFLFVRVEVGYYRRGSEIYESSIEPYGSSPARVTSHYLGIQFHGRLRGDVGPLGVYLFGGSSTEQLMSTGCLEVYCDSLGEDVPTVWGVSGGVGLDWGLPGGTQVALEHRWVEGLSVAYRSERSEVRNRSREILLRFGVPVSWNVGVEAQSGG